MKTILPLLLFLTLSSCKKDISIQEQVITGQTMGTTYLVKYIAPEKKGLKRQVDSLLAAINQSVSTYIPTSTISKVNMAADEVVMVDKHFVNNFLGADEVYQNTDGAFNPAVMPLVNYYGFGFENLDSLKTIDTVEVKRLHALCRFENFELEGLKLRKHTAAAQLDFSAIAKGYGVDQVATLLLQEDIEHFLVEIGGEGYAKGTKKDGSAWKFGIRKPTSDSRTDYLKALPINEKGIATSGNYENFRELQDQKKIGHTIDPKTGFAQLVEEELLSTTVIAENCMIADAYATAFKAMGFQRSKEVLKDLPELQVFFIYRSNAEIQTFSTLEE